MNHLRVLFRDSARSAWEDEKREVKHGKSVYEAVSVSQYNDNVVDVGDDDHDMLLNMNSFLLGVYAKQTVK